MIKNQQTCRQRCRRDSLDPCRWAFRARYRWAAIFVKARCAATSTGSLYLNDSSSCQRWRFFCCCCPYRRPPDNEMEILTDPVVSTFPRPPRSSSSYFFLGWQSILHRRFRFLKIYYRLIYRSNFDALSLLQRGFFLILLKSRSFKSPSCSSSHWSDFFYRVWNTKDRTEAKGKNVRWKLFLYHITVRLSTNDINIWIAPFRLIYECHYEKFCMYYVHIYTFIMPHEMCVPEFLMKSHWDNIIQLVFLQIYLL